MLSVLLALFGCAPVAGGPPPTAMDPGVKREFGTSTTAAATSESPFVEQNLWVRKAVGSRSELQFSGGTFWSSGLFYHAAVGYRRYFQPPSASTRTGFDLKLGGLYYFEAGVPISIEITERNLWLTTHPSAGFNPFGLMHLPIGVSWRYKDKWRLSTTAGTRFLGANPPIFYLNGGLSVAF